MSRHHKTGLKPLKDLRIEERNLIMQQVYNALADNAQRIISEGATVLTFMIQYMLTTLEVMTDQLHGENIDFTMKLRNKSKAAIRDCEAFLEHFEPLIERKEEWSTDYFNFQRVMDNWFNTEADMQYKQISTEDRAREISRAAGLRYLDPYETNARRCFELGFREGALYADQHPTGGVVVTQGDKHLEIPIDTLVHHYLKTTKDVNIEIKKDIP